MKIKPLKKSREKEGFCTSNFGLLQKEEKKTKEHNKNGERKTNKQTKNPRSKTKS